jgi:hypothetical protein
VAKRTKPERTQEPAGQPQSAAAPSPFPPIADPDHCLHFGEWRDQAALDAHYASTEFANFQFSLEGLLARPSEMTLYSVSGSARPLSSRPLDPRDAD